MDYTKLKIIYLHSTEITQDHILWGLLEMGFDMEETPEHKVLLHEYEEKDVEEILPYLEGFDCVFTQDFSASVAEAAHRKNLIYISWVYDSPQRGLYMEEAKYKTNYIFSFDRMQVERIKRIGVENIFYCPMAGNASKVSSLNLNENVLDEYRGEISFVGKLYVRDYIKGLLDSFPPEYRQLFDEYVDRLALKWDGSSVYGKMPDKLADFMGRRIDFPGINSYSMGKIFCCETLVSIPYIAQLERKETLSALGKAHDVHLFTFHPEEAHDLEHVHIHGEVDNGKEAYKVFHHSKINLNLTMRGIETGVPRRVFDIMSAGGFVMSNFQSEAEYLFEPDKEIVLFKSLEECKEKADYYLRHEEERRQIALAGQKRVAEEYNYPALLTYIFNKIFT